MTNAFIPQPSVFCDFSVCGGFCLPYYCACALRSSRRFIPDAVIVCITRSDVVCTSTCYFIMLYAPIHLLLHYYHTLWHISPALARQCSGRCWRTPYNLIGSIIWQNTVTVKTTHYFLKETTEMTQDTYPHGKGGLECAKNINNSWTKTKLRAFAFARQYITMISFLSINVSKQLLTCLIKHNILKCLCCFHGFYGSRKPEMEGNVDITSLIGDAMIRVATLVKINDFSGFKHS